MALRSEEELLGLVGGLYDAALDESLWQDALRAFADAFDAQAAIFFVHDKTLGVNVFSAYTGLDPAHVAEFDRERAVVDPRNAWAASHRGWTALYDHFWYDEYEIDREPYYAWLAGQGLRYVLAVPLVNDDRYLGMATVQRTRAQGHVSRAEAALRLSGAGLQARRPADDARLQRLIGGAIRTGLSIAGQAGGATALARPGGRPIQALVAPLPRATPLFALERPAAIVFVTDPERTPEPPSDWLGQLWGLTPAEARLALLLSRGGGLKDAAQRLEIAEATARVHLAAVFRKTGARRQAELVRLLVMSVAGLGR